MPVWLNAIVTAVVSGAVTAWVAYAGEYHGVTWARFLVGAAVGAGVGLVNWWRRSPDERQR
jgi:hypothetical protein